MAKHGFDRSNDTILSISEWIMGAALAKIPADLIESSHERPIETRTRLCIKLISTTSKQAVWEDTSDIHIQRQVKKPIIIGNEEYKLSVYSLRDAINQIIKNLDEAYSHKKILFSPKN